MPVPIYDAADYAKALQEHLPRGRVWPRDPEAVQTQVMAGYSPTFARLHARAAYLLTDAFPATTVELLPEWEATLGLPDPCAGADQTIAQRQAHVVARLIQSDGPSIPSLTAYAATLGYTIEIQEFVPARAGILNAGDPLYGPDWAFVWRVTAPGVTTAFFAAGKSYAGEPLATWGNAVLECEIKRMAPAHTIVQFAYVGSLSAAIWDGQGWDTTAWVA